MNFGTMLERGRLYTIFVEKCKGDLRNLYNTLNKKIHISACF